MRRPFVPQDNEHKGNSHNYLLQSAKRISEWMMAFVVENFTTAFVCKCGLMFDNLPLPNIRCPCCFNRLQELIGGSSAGRATPNFSYHRPLHRCINAACYK